MIVSGLIHPDTNEQIVLVIKPPKIEAGKKKKKKQKGQKKTKDVWLHMPYEIEEDLNAFDIWSMK